MAESQQTVSSPAAAPMPFPVRIADLLPTEPSLGRDSFDPLRKALEEDGYIHTPVEIFVIDGVLVVVHGHHRCAVAAELGWEFVPCIWWTYDKKYFDSMRFIVKKRLAARMRGFNNMPLNPGRIDRVATLAKEAQEFFNTDSAGETWQDKVLKAASKGKSKPK